MKSPAVLTRVRGRAGSFLTTGTGKKRLVGAVLFVIILALFFAFNRFPKIDTIGGDLDAVTGPTIECFQGFCIEHDPSEGLIGRWFDFSLTYLQAVLVGMTFAFLAAGLLESFFFPPGSTGWFFSGGAMKRTLAAITVGPIVNLCAACIVPVSAAIHRRGGGVEGAIAAVQASATMNFLAIGMVFFVFTPLLGFSRVILAVIGALLLGRVVAFVVRSRAEPGASAASEPELIPLLPLELDLEDHTWRSALREGFRDWAKVTIRYQVRLWPIMVVAGFISGLAIQWLDTSTVSRYMGNDVQGVLIAATFGILINVPLLFEIPLVALLLILGMGVAPAATLLFTAAAGGPVTFWGLASYLPKRAIATFATATWALGVAGGLAVLLIATFVPQDIGEGAVRVVKGASAAEEVKRLGREPPRFQEAARQMGVDFKHSRDGDFFNLGGGAAAADFDNNGWLDIYVTNSKGPNALYRNDGDGTFTDVANQAGVADWRSRSYGAAWGDYDNSGHLDLYVANHGDSKLFRNNGDGTFSDVTSEARVGDSGPDHRTTGVAWGDFDRDGWLDLIVVRHVVTAGPQFEITSTVHAVLLGQCRTPEFLADPKVPRGVVIGDPHDFTNTTKRDFSGVVRSMTLYRNSGDGTFEDVTHLLDDGRGYPSNVKGAGFKPLFLDYDNDGYLDILVVNDFGHENQPNVLWRNEGPGLNGAWRFTDVSARAGVNVPMYGMGAAVGDYDNNGRLDIYLTDIGSSRFYENRDSGFVNVTAKAGNGRGVIPENGEVNRSIGWGAVFADLDNDGFLDLYLAAGYIDSDPCSNHPYQPNALFVNRGDGTFADVSRSSRTNDPGIGREVLAADFNNDGLLDLYVVNIGNLDGGEGVARLYLNVSESAGNWLKVAPLAADGRALGMGAIVSVTAGGLTRTQHVGIAQGHMSQSVTPVHFGLGGATTVDEVLIRWPNGAVQRFTDVPANQTLTAAQPAAGS